MFKNKPDFEDAVNMAIAKAIIQESRDVIMEAEKFMIIGHPVECEYLTKLSLELLKRGMEYREKVKVDVSDLE